MNSKKPRKEELKKVTPKPIEEKAKAPHIDRMREDADSLRKRGQQGRAGTMDKAIKLVEKFGREKRVPLKH